MQRNYDRANLCIGPAYRETAVGRVHGKRVSPAINSRDVLHDFDFVRIDFANMTVAQVAASAAVILTCFGCGQSHDGFTHNTKAADEAPVVRTVAREAKG